VPLAGTAPAGNRKDQFYPDRINLQVTGDPDGPGQAAAREPLTERRAETVTGIRQYTAKAHTGCHHAIDLRQGDLWLGPRRAVLDGNARTLQTHRIARPTLGNEEDAPVLSEGCEPLISRQDVPLRYRVGCAARRSALPRERFSPLALFGRRASALPRPLLGAKRTSCSKVAMSVEDPKATSATSRKRRVVHCGREEDGIG
jgi:hypothetical protein